MVRGEVDVAGVEGAAGDGAAGGVDGGAGAGHVTVPGMGDGIGEPYPGGGAAGGTESDGDVGDAPAEAAAGGGVAEGGVGDVPGVGDVGDADGEGLAGDARVIVPLVMQCWMVSLVMLALMLRVPQGMLRLLVPLVMTTVRVLHVMVLGVGPRMGGRQRFWAWALATPGGGPGGRWWSVGSPVLAVLVASSVGACPRESWRRVLMVRAV